MNSSHTLIARNEAVYPPQPQRKYGPVRTPRLSSSDSYIAVFNRFAARNAALPTSHSATLPQPTYFQEEKAQDPGARLTADSEMRLKANSRQVHRSRGVYSMAAKAALDQAEHENVVSGRIQAAAALDTAAADEVPVDQTAENEAVRENLTEARERERIEAEAREELAEMRRAMDDAASESSGTTYHDTEAFHDPAEAYRVMREEMEADMMPTTSLDYGIMAQNLLRHSGERYTREALREIIAGIRHSEVSARREQEAGHAAELERLREELRDARARRETGDPSGDRDLARARAEFESVSRALEALEAQTTETEAHNRQVRADEVDLMIRLNRLETQRQTLLRETTAAQTERQREIRNTEEIRAKKHEEEDRMVRMQEAARELETDLDREYAEKTAAIQKDLGDARKELSDKQATLVTLNDSIHREKEALREAEAERRRLARASSTESREAEREHDALLREIEERSDHLDALERRKHDIDDAIEKKTSEFRDLMDEYESELESAKKERLEAVKEKLAREEKEVLETAKRHRETEERRAREKRAEVERLERQRSALEKAVKEARGVMQTLHHDEQALRAQLQRIREETQAALHAASVESGVRPSGSGSVNPASSSSTSFFSPPGGNPSSTLDISVGRPDLPPHADPNTVPYDPEAGGPADIADLEDALSVAEQNVAEAAGESAESEASVSVARELERRASSRGEPAPHTKRGNKRLRRPRYLEDYYSGSINSSMY